MVTSRGKPRVVTSRGRPHVVTSRGRPRVVTSRGRPHVVTSRGRHFSTCYYGVGLVISHKKAYRKEREAYRYAFEFGCLVNNQSQVLSEGTCVIRAHDNLKMHVFEPLSSLYSNCCAICIAQQVQLQHDGPAVRREPHQRSACHHCTEVSRPPPAGHLRDLRVSLVMEIILRTHIPLHLSPPYQYNWVVGISPSLSSSNFCSVKEVWWSSG